MYRVRNDACGPPPKKDVTIDNTSPVSIIHLILECMQACHTTSALNVEPTYAASRMTGSLSTPLKTTSERGAHPTSSSVTKVWSKLATVFWISCMRCASGIDKASQRCSDTKRKRVDKGYSQLRVTRLYIECGVVQNKRSYSTLTYLGYVCVGNADKRDCESG
jgi:hypothetical protein